MRTSAESDEYYSGEDEDVGRFQVPRTNELSYGAPHPDTHCDNCFDSAGHSPMYISRDGVYNPSAHAIDSIYGVGDTSSWGPLAHTRDFAGGSPHRAALTSNAPCLSDKGKSSSKAAYTDESFDYRPLLPLCPIITIFSRLPITLLLLHFHLLGAIPLHPETIRFSHCTVYSSPSVSQNLVQQKYQKASKIVVLRRW